MSFKYEHLDASKLEFKKEVKEAGRILIKIPRLGRLHPVSREVFLQAVKAGNHHDKIQGLCTHESIKKATAKPKSKKDES